MACLRQSKTAFPFAAQKNDKVILTETKWTCPKSTTCLRFKCEGVGEHFRPRVIVVIRCHRKKKCLWDVQNATLVAEAKSRTFSALEQLLAECPNAWVVSFCHGCRFESTRAKLWTDESHQGSSRAFSTGRRQFTLYSSRYKPAIVNAQWVVPACAANYSEEDFSAACPSLPQTRVGSFSAILVASPWHGLRNDDRRIEHHQSCRSVNLQQNHNKLPRVFHRLSFQKREKRGKLRTEHAMNIYESMNLRKIEKDCTRIWKKMHHEIHDKRCQTSKQSQTPSWNPTLAPRGSVFPQVIAKSKLRQKWDIAILLITPLEGGGGVKNV